MRRAGDLWPRIVSFENLRAAALRAARGKRHVASVARSPAPATRFQIKDPKERTISVLPFPDRVVHHALVGPLEPIFERRMISDSYACRRGKGTHAALERAREFLRRYDWFLALDVLHCFESLDHGVVLETVSRIVKDARVLDLFERIVRTPEGKGLPIGALTSQWLANLVLDRLDHHVKEALRVKGYLRYLDDMVLFSDDPLELRAAHESIAAYLADPLSLVLKLRATILAPAHQGLPFLGWRLYRGLARIRPANLRRTRRRLAVRRRQFATGRLSEEALAASVASTIAHLEHGTTRALRRRWFDQED